MSNNHVVYITGLDEDQMMTPLDELVLIVFVLASVMVNNTIKNINYAKT